MCSILFCLFKKYQHILFIWKTFFQPGILTNALFEFLNKMHFLQAKIFLHFLHSEEFFSLLTSNSFWLLWTVLEITFSQPTTQLISKQTCFFQVWLRLEWFIFGGQIAEWSKSSLRSWSGPGDREFKSRLQQKMY